jgi:hypothetical protein
MIRKMLGVATSVVAALAVVGVAWAATDDTGPTAAAEVEATVSTEVTTPESVTSPTIDATSSTLDDDPSESTATTIDDSDDDDMGESTDSTVDDSRDHDDDDDTTSTTIRSTTSTSEDDKTATTIDDSTVTTLDDRDDHDDHDDHDDRRAPDGVTSYALPGVGTVTVEVAGGVFSGVEVSAPGWDLVQKHMEPDEVEVELASNGQEAEFEARIDDGRVKVEFEVDSD